MNIGEFLRKIRKSRNYTLSNAARALGIPKSTLSDYERNITNPSIIKFYKIVRFYGLSAIDAVFEREVIDITNYSDIGKQKAYILELEERKKKEQLQHKQ